MTGPVAVGYPDFNRALAQSDTILVQDRNRPANAIVDYGVFPVTNAKALFVSGSTSVGHMRVVLAFHADAAGTQPIGYYEVTCRLGDSMTQPVRALGPFVSITVNPGSVVPFTYSLTVTTTADMASQSAREFEDAMVTQDNIAINAGATATIEVAVVMAGPAYWNATCGAATWFARMSAVDEFGAQTTLDIITQQYAIGEVRPIYLPGSHIRCILTNTSGANSTFHMFASRGYLDHG